MVLLRNIKLDQWLRDFLRKNDQTILTLTRLSTIRVLLALASIYNLEIHQMDVKTTFLNGDLEEKIYMNQPEGFIVSGQEHKVCKLIKSLYRLK